MNISDVFGKAVGHLFLGGPANVSWERALEGLSAADAGQKPEHLPHSVAQVVAHVQFWLVWPEITGSRLSSFAWLEVLVSVVTILFFVVWEARRLGLPFFLSQREKSLKDQT